MNARAPSRRPPDVTVVTGATGWLGPALLDAPRDARRAVTHRPGIVRALVRQRRGRRRSRALAGVEAVVGDVAHGPRARPAVRRPRHGGDGRRDPHRRASSIPSDATTSSRSTRAARPTSPPPPARPACAGWSTCRRTARSAPTRTAGDVFRNDEPYHPYLRLRPIEDAGRAAPCSTRSSAASTRSSCARRGSTGRSSRPARPTFFRHGAHAAASRSSATAASGARWSTSTTSSTGWCAPSSPTRRPGGVGGSPTPGRTTIVEIVETVRPRAGRRRASTSPIGSCACRPSPAASPSAPTACCRQPGRYNAPDPRARRAGQDHRLRHLRRHRRARLRPADRRSHEGMRRSHRAGASSRGVAL